MAVAVGQGAGEELPGVRLRVAGNLLRGTRGDDLSALFAAFGTEINEPVGGFDDVEIVFDDKEGSASVEQFPESGEEFRNVVKVQAGGGLVEDVENAAIFGTREVSG